MKTFLDLPVADNAALKSEMEDPMDGLSQAALDSVEQGGMTSPVSMKTGVTDDTRPTDCLSPVLHLSFEPLPVQQCTRAPFAREEIQI